ncbi:hypothetical protein NC652_026148 [Populus alba x Populus x berolinensis]|nr:hypothetical protein NC652_026148 [Populus alba x Populus x berolinensis]
MDTGDGLILSTTMLEGRLHIRPIFGLLSCRLDLGRDENKVPVSFPSQTDLLITTQRIALRFS